MLKINQPNFVNRVCQVTLEAFWTQKVRGGGEGFDRTDSLLEGLGAGWTASFLAKNYSTIFDKGIPPSSIGSIDC